ncbi:MAG: chorismate synthase [Lawsonibacter sp.]|jgi:chorismate synthase
MASYLGKNLHVSVFGQSHSRAIGVCVDGLPAGERVDLEQLRQFMQRRAPGRDGTATSRREADVPEIMCGLVNEVTCGAPLAAWIANTNTRSQDYEQIQDVPRPGHADWTAQVRYGGYQDVAGGGHFSGRLTAPLCVAGGIALQILARRGIEVAAHIYRIGETADRPFFSMGESRQTIERIKNASFPVLEAEAGEGMRQTILTARAEGDSVGGVVECLAIGLPPGIGDPMFGGMESRLAAALFGIPAVKGVEFGEGFDAAYMRGSEHNDPFQIVNGVISPASNHAGGLLGGITTGLPLLLRVAFKPTPSIGKEQQSVSYSNETEVKLRVGGRHDPCIVPRAVPVVEAVTALVLLDALLDGPARWENGVASRQNGEEN